MALSLHAFLIYCLSRTCQQVPEALTYRRGRSKLITFEDVNVATPIDKRLAGGLRIPVTYLVRAAQAKSLAEITLELRNATKLLDLGGDRTVQLRRRFSFLPRLVRSWLARRMVSNPLLLNKFYGNTAITSVVRGGSTFPMFRASLPYTHFPWLSAHSASGSVWQVTANSSADRFFASLS